MGGQQALCCILYYNLLPCKVFRIVSPRIVFYITLYHLHQIVSPCIFLHRIVSPCGGVELRSPPGEITADQFESDSAPPPGGEMHRIIQRSH